jgi:DNA-binding transcriptional MerR regulator
MNRDGAHYSVGQVSELAGVSVRALHHYDEVGLLKPSARTGSGYRLYGPADLERLQRILFYRELGFPLEQIATILDEPQIGAVTHLSRQHGLVTDRIERLQKVLTAIEKEMEANKMGVELTPEDRFEVWGDFVPEDHEDEVEERWGSTDAYKESQLRTARYDKSDWVTIKAEADDTIRRLAALMASGESSDGEAAMDLAEEHRQHITKWFYDCSYDIHLGLAEMYVNDPRFKENYEKIAEGLAGYLRDVIVANAGRAGAGSSRSAP